jgi:pimeloyl-ACP methyl ester carboxylesterase
MASLSRHTFNVKGAPAAMLRSERDGKPLVFVHGGIAGSSPYCSGSHIWGPVLDRFAASHPVLAVDLPGQGGTGLSAAPTIDASVEWLADALAALGIARCFVVGHDLGGLIALELAMRLPAMVCGLSLVSSVVAAPTGDGVENLTLAYPPAPLWSRHSQRWAFEQLSYAPCHITYDLLDACVVAAGQPGHRAAAATVREGALESELTPSVMRAKARFYEVCRGEGIPVPVQVIWGSHERLGSLDHGMWLYRLVAARQTAAQFHIINRVGSFPFREDPQTFHQLIDSFCEAVFPRP